MLVPRIAALGCLLALGCHASVQADAKANTDGEADAELDAEVQKERAVAGTEGTKPDAPATTVAAADSKKPLLGARSDLTLVPAQIAGQCSCLRVALGPANLGAFRWAAEAPAVDDQTQLALALSSEGSGCKDPKGSQGASYWGYGRKGDDVVVYIENGVQGRPLAQGAIIPKPFGQGQVYVAPAKKGVIYGKAADGTGRCKLGNPGVTRTIPVTPDEMGAGTGSPAGDATSDEDLLTGR
ncbi:MAG TPA: hypothetical protein VFV94_02185 [Polyangiaceae bacterium]|nr:hypothetical protein [Polyangiaceae bacterium]